MSQRIYHEGRSYRVPKNFNHRQGKMSSAAFTRKLQKAELGIFEGRDWGFGAVAAITAVIVITAISLNM